MLLSVIIPVYNEEKTIGELLKKVLREKTDKEIIVVDDGSTDRTREIVQELVRRLSGKGFNHKVKLKIFENVRNMGKGAAVRKGIGQARGDVLIIQDADLEYNPEDYQRLLKPILSGGVKVVYGSRLKDLKLQFWGKDRTPMPIHYFCNRFLSLLTNLLYGSGLTDMETCYKMFTKEVYRKLYLVSDRFEIEPEITAKILKMGYKIDEVPIIVRPRSYKEGKKIKARDGLLAVKTLIKFWR